MYRPNFRHSAAPSKAMAAESTAAELVRMASFEDEVSLPTADGAAASSRGLESPNRPWLDRVHARVRPDELYREEIVRSIFGDVGKPVEGACISRLTLVGEVCCSEVAKIDYAAFCG